MGIYVCKRLIFALTCPKYDLNILNKCVQHWQLRITNTIAGVVVSTVRAENYLYGSYITAILNRQLYSNGACHGALLPQLPFLLFLCLHMVYSSLHYTIFQFLKSCLVSISDCCCIYYYSHSRLCSSHQFPSL